MFGKPNRKFCIKGVITFINCASVRLYLKINNIFGFCKVAACAIVILSGVYQLFQGNTENLQRPFEGTNLGFGAIALSFYSGLW
jgi:solute carrier family 7 (L-type amino acid transporter), member 9/15